MSHHYNEPCEPECYGCKSLAKCIKKLEQALQDISDSCHAAFNKGNDPAGTLGRIVDRIQKVREEK